MRNAGYSLHAIVYQIFGQDIRDVELSEDVLVVSHTNNVFRFYSFLWVIDNCTVLKARLGEWVEMGDGRTGIVGEPEFGVPITTKMTGLGRTNPEIV